MADRPSTLSDFVDPDVPEPYIKRRRVYWSPTKENKPCGFVGYERNRGLTCYVSRRLGSHFYYKGGGYAISNSILTKLKNTSVTHVYLWEPAEAKGNVHEFALKQFLEGGEQVPKSDLETPTDPQTYVPLDNRLRLWEGHADDLFVRTFEQAMDSLLS